MNSLLRKSIIFLLMESIFQTGVCVVDIKNKGFEYEPFKEKSADSKVHVDNRRIKKESSTQAFWRDHKIKIVMGSILIMTVLVSSTILMELRLRWVEEERDQLAQSNGKLRLSLKRTEEARDQLAQNGKLRLSLKRTEEERDQLAQSNGKLRLSLKRTEEERDQLAQSNGKLRLSLKRTEEARDQLKLSSEFYERLNQQRCEFYKKLSQQYALESII